MSTTINYQCPHCTRSFQTVVGLNTHIGKAHKIENVEQHQCQYCHEIFSFKQSLTRHYNICKEKDLTQLQKQLEDCDQEIKRLKVQLESAEVYKQQYQQMEREYLMYQGKVEAYESMSKITPAIAPAPTFSPTINFAPNISVDTYKQANDYKQINQHHKTTNNNLYANLPPITDELIRSFSKQLHADPNKPIVNQTTGGFAQVICNLGLNKSTAVLDASRNKIVWLNGDKNNEEVTDVGALALANKLVVASEEDMARIVRYAAGKVQEYLARQDLDQCTYWANVLKAASNFNKDTFKTDPKVLEDIGKNISKVANTSATISSIQTHPQPLPQPSQQPLLSSVTEQPE